MRFSFISCFMFSVFCFVIISCSNKADKQSLLAYLNDPENGLKQETTAGDYKISLTYRPTDLIIEQEGVTDPKKIAEKKKEYSKYHYFILNMSLGGDKDVLYKGSGSQQQFSASLNRLNFGLSEFIYARRDEKDTLYLADYYVPNLYGMGGSTQILLAFPNETNKKYEQLEVNIKEMGFGTGNQKFIFKREDLEDIPTLKASL
jgi:hypothetical protein